MSQDTGNDLPTEGLKPSESDLEAQRDTIRRQLLADMGEMLSKQAEHYSKEYSGLYLKGCLETLLSVRSEFDKITNRILGGEK